jgi:N-acetylglucosamine kinase-like BadF-type ATPase
MTPDTVIAIDSGQTAIKVRLGSEQPLSFPGLRANSSLLPQLADVVGKVAEQAGPGPRKVYVGTCGLTRRDNDPVELLRLCEHYGVESVILAHDAATSFLGAIGDRRGVVVAAGTGAITLGVGVETIARIDGWGNVIGDAGGGYWIGREALDAVHRAHDGRGPETSLTPVVERRFPDLESAYIELQTDADWVRIVASFAQQVASLAAQDSVAAAICEEAGRQLAHSAATAVERIGEAGQENPVISLVGGTLSGGAVRHSCVAALQERWPDFVPFPAQGTSLDGAAALGKLDPAHPLFGQIGRATRAGRQ